MSVPPYSGPTRLSDRAAARHGQHRSDPPRAAHNPGRDRTALEAIDATEAGDHAHTVERTLQLHGAEIFGWLLATLPSEADAADAFSLFSEDLWKSLARHEGRCSIRTWCFMLARHAAARMIEARRSGRAVPLSEAPLRQLAAQVRDATASYLRTEVKQRVRSLRAELPLDDQTLLVLRVDKDLGWRDIAIVMLGGDVDDAELARHAARLRKRFERVKAQLRELAARDRIATGPAHRT
jgi:RNA polymerase sigma-70 factor, ECF subfamily